MCIGRGKELYMQCIARYLLENTIQEQYAAQMMQHLGYIYMSQASGQLTAIGSKGQPLLAPALGRLLSYYRHDFTVWKTCSTIYLTLVRPSSTTASVYHKRVVLVRLHQSGSPCSGVSGFQRHFLGSSNWCRSAWSEPQVSHLTSFLALSHTCRGYLELSGKN